MQVLFTGAPQIVGEPTGRDFDDGERLIELRVGEDVYLFVATGKTAERDGYTYEVFEYRKPEHSGLRRTIRSLHR